MSHVVNIRNKKQLSESWDNTIIWIVTGPEGILCFKKFNEDELIPKNLSTELVIISKSMLLNKLEKYVKDQATYSVHY